ncbi:hypothetical protein [Nocardia tengchongensis]|uniref:hypothetical protein n=1 Tax=Nocardia tengchongensis TaxID=2055889 RepID=UPI0036D0BC41
MPEFDSEYISLAELLAEAQKQHSLQSPRCNGLMEPPAPVRPFSTCAVCGFEDYTEWPATQDRTAELEAAHARIAELERDVKRWQGLTQRWRQLARDRRDDLLIANVELERANARIAELQQQAALWRCMATETSCDLDDHRAFWCTLPKGHVGMHHAELPPLPVRCDRGIPFLGVVESPVRVDWPQEPEVNRG